MLRSICRATRAARSISATVASRVAIIGAGSLFESDDGGIIVATAIRGGAPASLRAMRSRNCFRASSVLLLIHTSPPGHPRTLGGANKFCPIPATANASGSVSSGAMSSCRSAPTTISTGLFTSVPRLSAAQKAFVSSRPRTATLRSYFAARNARAMRSTLNRSGSGETNSFQSFATMNSAVSRRSSTRSRMSSPSRYPRLPNTVFSPSS